MSVLLSGFTRGGLSTVTGGAPLLPSPLELPARDLYALLMAYYESNGLYDQLAVSGYEVGVWQPGRKPLRNPAFRAVEFYVDSVWPGALPDALPVQVAGKDAPQGLKDAIHKVWQWSNWAANKDVAMRWLAIQGDMFLKAVRRDDAQGQPQRVYLQLIEPSAVSDFDKDERDFLTYIRLDTPQTRRERDGKLKAFMRTEVWSKDDGTFRVWEHNKPLDTDLDRLGNPLISRAIEEFGIDFVPFVHAKFRDLGRPRGLGAYVHCMDKIDEANQMATRLHQMLFRHNKPFWALRANSMDASGRPLPAPRIGNSDGTQASDIIPLGDDTVVRLPGMSELQSMIPDIKYDAALAVLQDHMGDMEKDLPELIYYRLPDMGELSGRAVRLLLSGGVKRALAVRGNAEAALARADMMALTLGRVARLDGFTGIGDFENGDFEHTFAVRDIIPVSEDEHAEAVGKKYTAVKMGFDAEVPAEYILEHDFDTPPDELKDFAKAKKAAIELAQEDAQPDPLEAQARQGQQGGPPNGNQQNQQPNQPGGGQQPPRPAR